MDAILFGWSSYKIVYNDLVQHPRWPPRLIMKLLIFRQCYKFLKSDLTNRLDYI
jgi:hypothetical protein